MDVLKYFLDNVCKHSDKFSYERLENIAEIFKKGDIVPIALLEWRRDIGHFMIRFRLGLQSSEVAALARDMAIQDCALIFEDDFLIDLQYGYLYGDDARKSFIDQLQKKTKVDKKDPMEGAFYFSEEPIFAYGYNKPGKTILEKYWGDE